MLHPKEAESASFDCFLTKNRLSEEAESASFDSPARIGLTDNSRALIRVLTKQHLSF